MKKLVGGDAIKLAIKTVGGSYGTLAPFVRAARATMVNLLLLPPERETTLAKRHCTKGSQVANLKNLQIYVNNCQFLHEAPSWREHTYKSKLHTYKHTVAHTVHGNKAILC